MQSRLLALLFACAPLFGQEEEDVAFSVSGEVVTTAGRACEGAHVQLWDALASDRPLARATVDKQGKFVLTVPRSAAARREHAFGPVRIEAAQAGRARTGGTVAPGTSKLRIVLARPAEWTGVVRGADGTPLPGAPVRAQQGELWFATTTDENGVYRFTDMGTGRVDLGRSTITEYPTMIHVRAEGHKLRRFGAAAGEPVDIRLKKNPIGTGRVVEHGTNKPLAGVRLVALHGSSPVETVTDADGRFELEIEENAGRVGAYLDGFAATYFLVQPARGAQEHPLQRAESVGGTVVNEEGGAIPFASVRLDPGFGNPLRVRCDETGSYRFPLGVLDFGRVTASRPGFMPGESTVDANWRPDRVSVELKRGREVKGSVEMDGAGVMGAEVVFRGFAPPGGWRVLRARLHQRFKGKYRARAVPPEATHVFARLADARAASWPSWTMSSIFEVAPQLPVRGTIVDDEGRPLEGVAVQIGEKASGRTDAQGRFVIPDVPVGRTRLFVAWPNTHVGETQHVSPGDPVTIVAQRSCAASSCCPVCVHGAPLRLYAEVVLRRGEHGAPPLVGRCRGRGRSSRHLDSGKYTVAIEAAGYIPFEQRESSSPRDGSKRGSMRSWNVRGPWC